ncbi:MAG: hypothetical protein ACYCZF_12705 [Anaerolineae bacterium]
MKSYGMVILVCFLMLAALGTCQYAGWQSTVKTVTFVSSKTSEPTPSRSATTKPRATLYPTRKA